MKRVHSVIYLKEVVANTDRKFGSDTAYYPAWVDTTVRYVPAVFTAHEIEMAVERAKKNPEDFPPQSPLPAPPSRPLLQRFKDALGIK